MYNAYIKSYDMSQKERQSGYGVTAEMFVDVFCGWRFSRAERMRRETQKKLRLEHHQAVESALGPDKAEKRAFG